MGTILLFARTLFALAAVLLLVSSLSRLMRRSQNGGLRRRTGAPAGASLEVLGRRSLSRTSAIALVRVGDRKLVLGTTPQSVTLLSELPASEAESTSQQREIDTPWTAESRQTPLAWDAVISKLRERSIRR